MLFTICNIHKNVHLVISSFSSENFSLVLNRICMFKRCLAITPLIMDLELSAIFPGLLPYPMLGHVHELI